MPRFASCRSSYSVTGNLFDQSGTGAIVILFADLASNLALTNNDFFVV